MENGRTRDFGPSRAAPSRGATVIDVGGKLVTPGIINGLHGPRTPSARPAIRSSGNTHSTGVTTTTSSVASIRMTCRSSTKKQKALTCARRAHWHDRDVPLHVRAVQTGPENKTPEEARAKVDEIARGDTDFVKV